MRLTYDKRANAAYLYLVEGVEANGSSDVHNDIVIDYHDGEIIGIEFLNANKQLPIKVLAVAETEKMYSGSLV